MFINRSSADVSVDTDMVTLAILTVFPDAASMALWTLAALLACLCRQSESPHAVIKRLCGAFA